MKVPEFLRLGGAEPRASACVETLECVLDELATFGLPTITRMDHGGWWCYIRMHTPGYVGATFEVQSGTKSATPLAAVSECLQRVHAAASHGKAVTA